jgi:hypothetical protein
LGLFEYWTTIALALISAGPPVFGRIVGTVFGFTGIVIIATG